MSDIKYLTIDTLDARDIERIFSKIEVDPVTDCWNWTGGLFTQGYGCVSWKGKAERIHRLMYAWLVAPLQKVPHKGIRKNIPSLDHLCRNRKCANPEHLELTDQRTNVLRGIGHCSINAKKIHCPYGHILEAKGNRRFCRTCANAERRKRYHKNPQRYIKKTLKWRSENPERYKETSIKWREKNPEYAKKWYESQKNHQISPS